MIKLVKINGMLIIGNNFYPVIKCHLPSTFHFRYTFKYFARIMGLKKITTVAYAEVYIKEKNKVKINFSRYDKRRAKLYEIPESTIEEILADSELSDGEHEFIRNIAGFKYPIKIVVSVEKHIITVITNYPLKKGRTK